MADSADQDPTPFLKKAFDATTGVVTALDPVTGLVALGIRMVWEFCDLKGAEEARKRKG